MEFLFLVAFAFVMILALVLGQAEADRCRRELTRLAQDLDGGRAHLAEGLFSGRADHRVTGRLAGYQVSVGFFLRGGKNKTLYVRYRVEVPGAAGELKVSEASVLHDLGAWLGLVDDVQTGDAVVDRRFAIRGSQRAADRAFSQAEARMTFDALFGRGFREVALEGGALSGYRRASGFTADSLRTDLEDLVGLARLFTREKVVVKVLGAEPRFAWTAGRGAALCPYCRDALDVEGADPIDECPHCRTLHHAECLREAGGCTVMGCRGRGRARA